MRQIVFELCAETPSACMAGERGGADRIELCSGLSEGGVTPSHALIRWAVTRCKLPIHVLLRPRAGDFVYTDDEFAVIREDLLHARSLGVAGVVLGFLLPDGEIDTARTRDMVSLSRPLEVTFHRAFDGAASLEPALEDVIAAGCQRLLTSGQAANVKEGAPVLRRLVEQAAGRIEIAAGGGLRLADAAAVAERTGAKHFHGSLQRRDPNGAAAGQASLSHSSRGEVSVEDAQAMIARLRGGMPDTSQG